MGWLARYHQASRAKRELHKIDNLLETERYTEALGLLEEFLRSFPDKREGYHKYLLICRKVKALQRAEHFLHQIAVDFGADSPNPNNYLAASYYFQGKVMEAKVLWEQVIRDYPHFAPAFSNLGAVFMHLGKNDQALLKFKVAIQLEPEYSLSAYNNIAEIYIAKGEYSQAIACLKDAQTMPGELETIYANLGHCYLALGEDEAAVAQYERCLASAESFTVNDSKAEVYVNLVRLYLERHENRAALDRCLEGINDIPKNAALWSQLGQVYLARKEYENAVGAFHKSLSLSPMSSRNLLVHRRLALAYFQLGKFGKATAEYRRAMAWHPDLPRAIFEQECRTAEEHLHRCKEQLLTEATSEVYQNMGDAHFALGDLEEAITAYEAAIKLDPGAIFSYVGLGMVYYSMDQHIHAIRHFSRALEVDRQCVEGHLGLGLTYLSQGSTSMTIIKFRWAVSLGPGNPKAVNFLGSAYWMTNDYEQAEDCFRRALLLDPGYAQAHNNLGQLMLDRGRYQESVIQFCEALQIFPDYVPALCYLGRAYQELGQTEEAVRAWRNALRINPNNPLAERYLADVSGRETAMAAED